MIVGEILKRKFQYYANERSNEGEKRGNSLEFIISILDNVAFFQLLIFNSRTIVNSIRRFKATRLP